MGGIRLSGRTVLPPICPSFPLMTSLNAAGSDSQMHRIGEGLTPCTLTSTAEILGTPWYQCDPMLSPDNAEIVYGFTQDVPASPDFRAELRVVQADDSNDELIHQWTPVHGNMAMSPHWNPNGNQIIFIQHPETWPITAGDDTFIKRINRNGTGLTTLLTWDTLGDGQIPWCSYSPSGDYIAFGVIPFSILEVPQPGELWVMDADGSNVTMLYSAAYTNNFGHGFGGAAWQRSSDVLGFMDVSALSASASNHAKKINADGTGLTTLFTETGVASARFYFGCGKWSWLSDDSGFFIKKWTGGGSSLFSRTEDLVAIVDGGGGGVTDYAATETAANGAHSIPWAYHGTAAIEDPRIYWSDLPDGSGVVTRRVVKSCLEDGTDIRTDWDGQDYTPDRAHHGVYNLSNN